jgi:hypothetical protein
VGRLEFELMDDVRSCLIGTCATCIAVVFDDISDMLLLYCRWAKLKLVLIW